MRIAILSLRCSCDYLQIGGAESLVRRLAHGLADMGHTVHYVLYGDDTSHVLPVNQRISVHYCSQFDDALSILRGSYDHVLMVYLLGRDRLRYAQFQLSQREISFHKLALGTPASLKQWGAFMAEVAATTRNGCVFTTSPVTSKVLSSLGAKAILIPPPVPKAYFQSARQSHVNGHPLTVTFLGRLAPEKGWQEARVVFEHLRGVGAVQTHAFGYSASGHEDGLVREQWHDGTCVSQQRTSRLIYDPQGEERIREVLCRTDILLLPYRSMSGTIDPPLLLLEGMAAGCAIITRPAGQVGYIYGTDTPFVVRDGDYAEQATHLIESIRRDSTVLTAERQRVQERVRALAFESSLVSEQFVHAMKANS